MKRANHLFKAICDMENLRRSYLLARRGKRARPDVVAFSDNLAEILLWIRQSMLEGTLEFGPYRAFTIHEPKERIIRVAPFADRVAHHALMRLSEPVFEAYQIDESYACRKGKGTYAALERAKAHSLKYAWFLKLDMRKYFDSISHERLKELLSRRFKERAVLDLFDRIVDSHGSDTFPENNLKPSMGFEPHEPRRQLEQQRQELPFGEPQQQHPLEPQQQHRFAGWLRTPSSEVGTDVSTEPDGFWVSLWRRIVNGVSTLFGGWTDASFAPFYPLSIQFEQG